ncbi:hypothetical protein SKTS_25400 [Sulfurimicrobium lacus]|uniref:TraB/GumN family protein n=2 Tax=Sulfurimicrobium lacus TaxID=2715678 RepID=A0A6F8VDA0_9PROT|nr:hypothetical protein SKTS_25400 [Sulfurimicrobium lacus]
MRSSLLPEGKVLGDLLTPEMRDRLIKFLGKYHKPATELDRDKVWAAAAAVPFLAAMNTFPRNFGAASKSLDDYLAQRSLARKVPLLGIETVREQVAWEDSLTIVEQQAFLIEVLDSDENQGEAEQWLIRQFRKGDIDALREDYLDKRANIPAFGKAVEKFIFSRNETQAKRIDKMVRNGSECVFAVGAMHLGGEGGVIRLLRRHGYTIRQF